MNTPEISSFFVESPSALCKCCYQHIQSYETNQDNYLSRQHREIAFFQRAAPKRTGPLKMRWLFGENPDIHTFGNDLPEKNNPIGEEEEMGLRRKQIILQQRASFEHRLKDRLAFLSEKGIKSPKADKDTLVRKLQADIRAANRRLRLIADNEKRTEEMAKTKAERAAAPRKEEGAKGEKPKKGPEEGKGKKTGKAPDGVKRQKATESPQEGKAMMKKTGEETREEPAGPVKADK